MADLKLNELKTLESVAKMIGIDASGNATITTIGMVRDFLKLTRFYSLHTNLIGTENSIFGRIGLVFAYSSSNPENFMIYAFTTNLR